MLRRSVTQAGDHRDNLVAGGFAGPPDPHLADRVEALGGTIWIASPPGEGTSLRVELSLDQ